MERHMPMKFIGNFCQLSLLPIPLAQPFPINTSHSIPPASFLSNYIPIWESSARVLSLGYTQLFVCSKWSSFLARFYYSWCKKSKIYLKLISTWNTWRVTHDYQTLNRRPEGENIPYLEGSLHTTIFSKYAELLRLNNIFRIFWNYFWNILEINAFQNKNVKSAVIF